LLESTGQVKRGRGARLTRAAKRFSYGVPTTSDTLRLLRHIRSSPQELKQSKNNFYHRSRPEEVLCARSERRASCIEGAHQFSLRRRNSKEPIRRSIAAGNSFDLIYL